MKIFGKKIVNIRNETAGVGINDAAIYDLLGIKDTNSSNMNEIVYYRCLKILSESISKLPLKIYKETKNGNEKVEHYLNYLLRIQPNQYYSASTFWSSVEWSRNHFGNAYVYIATDIKGKVSNLWLLESKNVEILIDDKGVFGNKNAIWYIYNCNGNKYKISQDSMLHFKNWYTKDGAGLVGMAVKDVLESYISRNANSNNFLNNMAKNGWISDKIVIQYTGNLSTNSEKVLIEKLENFSTVASGKMIPLPLGLTATNLSSKLTDGQFLELNQYNSLQIAMAFGISAQDLNDFSRATYNNSTTQYEMFYKSTLLPILLHYEQELAIKLFTNKEKKEGYYFNFNVDSILRANLKERMESYSVAVQNGIMTTNECRKLENKEALEGGDELLCNGNMIRVKDAGTENKGGVSN